MGPSEEHAQQLQIDFMLCELASRALAEAETREVLVHFSFRAHLEGHPRSMAVIERLPFGRLWGGDWVRES